MTATMLCMTLFDKKLEQVKMPYMIKLLLILVAAVFWPLFWVWMVWLKTKNIRLKRATIKRAEELHE